MTHYKVYSGNDKREERYGKHTAILIQRQEPEEEEEVKEASPQPTPTKYVPREEKLTDKQKSIAISARGLAELFGHGGY